LPCIGYQHKENQVPSFKQILFPVDFSKQNRAMAPHVACMAARYRARVTMLHVLEIPAEVYPGWPAYAGLIDLPSMIEDRKRQLQLFLKSEFETVSTTRLVFEGAPGQVILDFAAKEKADLIMMPTHGYGPFRRFLLGSVTAKILHGAHCPVWTGAHMRETPAAFEGYNTLLCGVDLTPSSLPLLRWAYEFACERRATLKLVHAIPAGKPLAGFDIDGAMFRSSLFEMAKAELTKLQSEAGINLETVLEGDEVAAALRKAAEENRADLVIIGRGVMQESFGRMRTNVYSIIRESPCPVISL
jgi:nucleotide-binding universal stress UspA family protein